MTSLSMHSILTIRPPLSKAQKTLLSPRKPWVFASLAGKALLLFLALLSNQASALECTPGQDFACAITPKGGDWKTGPGNLRVDQDWLQLTSASQSQKGYTYINKAFSSSEGLSIEFEFSASQGGGSMQGRPPADGFSVFLFDASKSFRLGEYGGALGYKGLNGAYVGIGFDSFGNFSTHIGGGGRNPGVQQNSIVIRGPTRSYPYLTGKKLNFPLATRDRTRSPHKANISITPERGTYRITVKIEGDDFELSKLMPGQYRIPSRLKLGFAASTGGNWARHEIRNIRVNKPVDLSLEKSNLEFDMDGKVRYTLTAKNHGRQNNANGVAIQLNYPGFFQPDTDGIRCLATTSGSQCSLDGNSLPVMNLRVGGSASFTVTGSVKSGAHKGGSLHAELVPPPGYMNNSFEHIVDIPVGILSGRVFEDNHLANGSGPGISGASVVLARLEQGFNPNRPEIDNWTPAILTHTNANGEYAFPVPVEASKYRVVALSHTLGGTSGAWPEQTWGGKFRRCISGSATGNTIQTDRLHTDPGYCFGGRNPGTNDISNDIDALWLTYRNHCSNGFCPMLPPIPLGSHQIWNGEHTLQLPEDRIPAHPEGVDGLDFGFSYDVVTHTKDVVTHTNDSSQGSLRQFIANANLRQGSGKMLFIPATVQNNSRGWNIELQSSLPDLNQTDITIDGKAWSHQQPGQRALPDDTARSGVTAGAQQQVLPPLLKPDLQLVAGNSAASGNASSTVFSMNNARQAIVNLALVDSATSPPQYGIKASSSCDQCRVENTFIGLNSQGSRSIGRGFYTAIHSAPGSELSLVHNWIKGIRGTALFFQGSGVIANNLLEDNATEGKNSDAITLEDTTPNSTGRTVRVTGNHINGANAYALEGWQFINPDHLIVRNNTLSGGGRTRSSSADEGAGLRLQARSTFSGKVTASENLIAQNRGPGVVVSNYSGAASGKTVARGNRISQNRYENNQELPIDLGRHNQSNGDGETPNTGHYQDQWPNRGIDRPIITSALLEGNQLILEGYSMPGVQLEFYRQDGNSLRFHQTWVEGSSEDLSREDGQYQDPVSQQIIQQNRFQFKQVVTSIREGTRLGAIAIDASDNTSEFSPTITVQRAGTLEARLWKDLNNDGQPGKAEPPLGNIQVQLSRMNPATGQPLMIGNLATGSDGSVFFRALPPARYRVEVIPGQPGLENLTVGNSIKNPLELEIKSGDTSTALFGFVEGNPTLTLTPEHQKTTVAGVFVDLPHKLLSSMAGEVSVQADWMNQINQTLTWPIQLLKAQCKDDRNGQQALPLSQPIQLQPGKPECLVARFFVPAATPADFGATLGLTASFTKAGTNSGVQEAKPLTVQIKDRIVISDINSGQLVLNKWVENRSRNEKKSQSNKATPGEQLRYTITFSNAGSGPIKGLEIGDELPPWTQLAAPARCPSSYPESLGQCQVTVFGSSANQPGYTGKIRWQFSGSLSPGESGTVSYDIQVQ